MTHHIAEERLFDCYVAERSGERLDPPHAEHLTDCPECARRYAELAGFMDGLRAEAEADTDAIFTPERLQAQQHHIAAKIAHLGHPARVISFPLRVTGGNADRRGPRVATRWIAAAAAAGLFIGIGTGVFLETGPNARVTQTASASRPRLGPSPASRLALPDVAEDAFLSDLDLALERPQTPALRPLDAMTPHVREISNTR